MWPAIFVVFLSMTAIECELTYCGGTTHLSLRSSECVIATHDVQVAIAIGAAIGVYSRQKSALHPSGLPK